MRASVLSGDTGELRSLTHSTHKWECPAFQHLLDRAMCLKYRRIRVRTCRGVGVGDGNASKRLPSYHARPCIRLRKNPFKRVIKAVIGVRIPVRPAIDGDSDNVAYWIESAWAKYATELVADIALKCLKARGQQFRPTDAVLLLAR